MADDILVALVRALRDVALEEVADGAEDGPAGEELIRISRILVPDREPRGALAAVRALGEAEGEE